MYTIKKVSELVRIPTVTIRAWENRYGIVHPLRTEGGHRQYSRADVETLKWLKRQMEENGLKISEAARLLKQQKPIQSSPPLHDVIEETTAQGDPHAELAEGLYRRLMAFDRSGANDWINLAFSLYKTDDVFHRIIAPVMHRIGDEWEQGQISVSQEHFASEIVMSRFHLVMRAQAAGPHRARALAFCPEGELHQMGLMLFGLFMQSKGIDVIYLGPNTPYAGLTSLIEANDVSIVAVSASHARHLPALKEWLSECVARFPHLTFVLGGKAFLSCPAPLRPFVLGGSLAAWNQWLEGLALAASTGDRV